MRQLTQLFWMTVLSFIHALAPANCITLPRLAGMSINDELQSVKLTCLHIPLKKTGEEIRIPKYLLHMLNDQISMD